MKLDRNINPDGRGKYALVLVRKMPKPGAPEYARVRQALAVLDEAGMLDEGELGTEREFMVIRLRDRYAKPALTAYARTAKADGQDEYAGEIFEMVERSGTASPFCKTPD